MQNAESGRGDKPRDRCHSADYHTNLSTGKGRGNYRRLPKAGLKI